MNIERVFFRPRPRPTAPLPMGARSVGHRIIDTEVQIPRVHQPYHQFFWGIEGVGIIRISGHEYTLEPGQVARYQAGDLQCYRAGMSRWEYRWWTLDGDQAATIIASFGITWKAPRRAGSCPVDLFGALEEQIKDVRPAAERRAASTVFSLLAEVSGPEYRPHSQVVEDAIGMIDYGHADPLFGVALLAGKLKVHRATLARNFAEQVGMTPVEYLASVRVQRALALLKTTTLNVTEVAYRVGFSDANYFSRTIKRITGLTPTEFRAMRTA